MTKGDRIIRNVRLERDAGVSFGSRAGSLVYTDEAFWRSAVDKEREFESHGYVGWQVPRTSVYIGSYGESRANYVRGSWLE